MKKIPLFLVLLLAACSASKQLTSTTAAPATVVDGKLFTALFMQQAAEYRALCLQAYDLAKWRIDQKVSRAGARPMAIITDIDETVLDNSPYAVHQGLSGKDYEQQSWYNWTARGEADTIPGAPSFLKYAGSRGITVFYVTNRDEKERVGTLKNLQRFDLPNADNAHLLLKQNTSSKETRRQQVMKDFEVIMLVGDNLADFSSLFDKKTTEERKANVNTAAAAFGNLFIILPNPNYGDWESALYHYKYDLSPVQKDSVIRSVLKGY